MSEEAKSGGSGITRFVPVAAAIVILGVMGLALFSPDRETLPSTFINKQAPEMELPALFADRPGLNTANLADGKPKLVNIWASWCGPCRAEHPFLMELEAEGVDIRGFNYKDGEAQAKAFLAQLGDPYSAIGVDASGRMGIEWGVYGVPETFMVDGNGVIVEKIVGPITTSRQMARIREFIAER